MQFVEFDGRFDESGQANVSLGVSEFAREFGVDVFVAVEGVELEIGIEELPEERNLSRFPGFQFLSGRMLRDARQITVTLAGAAGRTFRGVVAWARRKASEEIKAWIDDPTCHGCQRIAMWTLRAGLAAVGIPTVGDGVADFGAEVAKQLLNALASDPLGSFCSSWFGDKFVQFVSDRLLKDGVERITGVTRFLSELIWGVCNDLGPCR